MKEIERLKSEISSLENQIQNKPSDKEKFTWKSNNKKSRIDQICKGREEGLEKLSIQLFGRVYAKQEQN